MSTQMEKLLAAHERAEQQKHDAERKAKLAKRQIAELQRKERTHRLIERGAYLEKKMREPDLFTDEEIFRFLDYAFNTPFVRDELEKQLRSKTHAAETPDIQTAPEGKKPADVG